MAESGNIAAPKPSSSVKLVLLGEAAVGKKTRSLQLGVRCLSLILPPPTRRYASPTLPRSYMIPEPHSQRANTSSNITAAFLTQKTALPTRTIKFEIWDTAGQERFASLAPMYYRNAQSALVVYDLTKPTSLVKAKHWVAELQRQASPGIVIALVGNKVDLTRESSADTGPETAATGGEEGGEGEEEEEGTTQGTEGDARKISTKEGRNYAEEEGLLFFETSAKSGANVQEVFTAIASAIPETQMRNSRTGAAGAAAGGGGGGAALGSDRVTLTGGREGPKEGCAC
ncbi:MAG: hypothetical protein Q9217_006560 [Psora testacea]